MNGIFGNWFASGARPARAAKVRLGLEVLEARDIPALGISGFAFHDLNANGLRDAGETAIANSTIRLYNSANQVVGSATTDANGFYRFLSDSTIAPSQQTITQTLQFADGPTNQNIIRSLNGFDPALGTLQRVEISVNGRITSQIRAENLDPVAALINGVVDGTILLDAPGVVGGASTTADVQSFSAARYDGATDFGGSSGVTFSARSATGTEQFIVTDASDLAYYAAGGAVQLIVTPQATSSASGGGNLVAQISSSGGAEITVTYVYLGSSALRASTYRVEQATTPVGYLDGRLSRNGLVLPTVTGPRAISVVYNATQEAPENNFAHLQASSVSGRVYIDANNDGQLQSQEIGIAGVRLTLTGTTDQGRSMTATATSDADGFYRFSSLRPGTYTVTQTPPRDFLVGQINDAGTLGGQGQSNKFVSVVVGSGAQGEEYNFGWLKPATLSGYLYTDKNHDGAFNAGDQGVRRLTVLLTGTDDLGNAVNRSARSDTAGYYEFTGLRPGSYTISQSQLPRGWRRGAINVGSIGGITTQDTTSDIFVGVGDLGRDYNFAFELAGFSKRNYLGSAWRQRN